MAALRGHFDGADSGISSNTSSNMDSRVAAAVQGQIQTSKQVVAAASGTSDTSGQAAQALGDQDEKNKGKIDVVKDELSRSPGRGGPDGPRLPQDAPASPLGWHPGDPRHRPYDAGPGGLGPPTPADGKPWVEVGPGSGIFVRPDELPSMKVMQPGGLGPSPFYDQSGNPVTYQELVPGSGVWVLPSEFPNAQFLPPGSLGPSGRYEEYIPGSGIWVWHEQMTSEPFQSHAPTPYLPTHPTLPTESAPPVPWPKAK